MNKKRAAVIFASILSCYAISATTASYYSARTGGSGVGIAKWDVTVEYTGETTNFEFDNEGTQTAEYAFSVTSGSEVALSYDVVITLPTALSNPDSLSFAIGESQRSISDNRIYTFSNVGSFDAGGGTNYHTLTISVRDFCERIELNGISVEVVARQDTRRGGA